MKNEKKKYHINITNYEAIFFQSQKVDRKPLLSEEWPTEPLECFVQPHGRPKSFIEKFHSNIIHS